MEEDLWEPLQYCRPYKRGSWVEMSHGGSIVTVNAFYSPNSNTMIVPIGMLQVTPTPLLPPPEAPRTRSTGASRSHSRSGPSGL